MAKKGLLGIAATAALICCALLGAQGGPKDKIERGRYLVEELGKCQECHTPRLENGDLNRAKWLKGAMVVTKPSYPVKKWEEMAPDLTLSGTAKEWGEAGLAKFLETGVGPEGQKADPPMPLYKLKPADAEAIAAYLNSLQ